jgi:PAS domain S-box-containing protein
VPDASNPEQTAPAGPTKDEQALPLADAMPQIVWSALPDGRADYFNQRWFEYTGLTLEQSQDMGWQSVVHPDDLQNCINGWDEAVRIGRPYQAEFRLKRAPQGPWRWHLVRALPIRGADGRPVRWIGTSTDIQDQKLAEEKLRRSEERMRSIVDTTYDAFIVTDADGRIIDWNRQAEIMFGLTRDEAKGKSLVETIIPGRHRQAHSEELSRSLALRAGPISCKRIESAALRRDGVEFPVEIRLSILPTDEGVLVCTAIRDVTERKRSEEELMRTTAELIRSNSDLERYAYLASHDLQEPLRAVTSFTQLLALEYADKLDADAREYLGYVVAGAKRMQALINQLLDYSRLGTQRKPFALVDCRRIYETAVADLKVAIDESGAILTRADLPQVMGDGVQLVQVFQNLLANAIKFRRCHGPQVHVWAEHTDKEWQFAVRDNGIGIDSRNFERLFVIFQRLHHRDEYAGTGIGLAVCKKIVELHGGRIWVESKPGEGSTFYFTIPAVNESRPFSTNSRD